MQTNSKIYLIIIFLSLIFLSCSSKPPNYYREIDIDGIQRIHNNFLNKFILFLKG